PATLDSVLRGPYDELSSSEIRKLFRPEQEELINDDAGADDEPVDATRLTQSAGGIGVAHFGTLASLASPSDVDYYRLRADLNPTQANVLTATTTGIFGTSVAPQFSLFDSELQAVPFQILANGNGTFTIQATGLTNHGDYYLRVVANSTGA